MEEIITRVTDRARKNFSRGFNCAECVLESVLETIDTGLPMESLRLATGFGGGIGLFGDSCGAITGAVMAVGAMHGRACLPGGEDRRKAARDAAGELYGNPGLYRLFNQIPNMVKSKYGHTLCRDICAPWKEDWLCREHALHCREIITDTARMAAQLILADKTDICSRPFGENVENLKDGPEGCKAEDCKAKG